MRKLVLSLAVGIACLLQPISSPDALAQAAYPNRPIKLVVPFPPGGVYDAIARPLADRLKDRLGTVVIENVGGAGGVRGSMTVARAAPDGYTLLLGGSSLMVVIPIASKRPQYDPMADFEALGRVSLVGLSIVAFPGTGLKDLKGLIEQAKANPGKLSYGTPGPGTTNHLTGELFNSLTRVPPIVHVPYTGAGPALNDLVGGHIPLAVVNVTGQVLDLRSAGKIAMLAVTTQARMTSAPDVPTAIESGVPNLVAESFFGLFGPKGMPKPVVDAIVAGVNGALGDPELRRIYDKAAFQTDRETSPDALRKFLASDVARWRPIIEASGFKIE